MNAERIITDLGFVFVSYAVVASTFHYARKAGAASEKRAMDELNHGAQTGVFHSNLYWRLEPLRAYVRGLLEVCGIGVLWSILLGFPVIMCIWNQR